MKLNIQLTLIFLSTFFISSSLHAALENSIKIGAGSFRPDEESQLPLIVTSFDHGANWSYAPDISSRANLPKDFTDEDNPYSTGNNSLVAVSCQKNFCLGVGRYKIPSKKYLPLVALSQNSGTSWTYTSIKPNDYKNDTGWMVDPIQTTCNSKMCLMAMPYINTNGNWSYFIAVTENQGQTWSYSKVIPKFPEGRAYITNFDCTDNTYVGVGYVDSGDPNGYLKDGFIIFSKDQAKTWNFAKFDVLKNHSYAFQDVKCKDNICIAKGLDRDRSTNVTTLFLLRSIDGGYSWTKIPNDYHVTFDMFNGNKIANTGKTWAIIGTSWIDKKESPLVLVSQDDGETWKQPTDTLTKHRLQKGHSSSSEGYLISCAGNDCVLITDGYDTATLAVSHDKGISWSYTDATPPDMGRYGVIPSMIIGDENSFIVLGEYSAKKGTKPYILVSRDHGKSWFWGNANIPPNITAELFSGTNGSGNGKRRHHIKY